MAVALAPYWGVGCDSGLHLAWLFRLRIGLCIGLFFCLLLRLGRVVSVCLGLALCLRLGLRLLVFLLRLRVRGVAVGLGRPPRHHPQTEPYHTKPL